MDQMFQRATFRNRQILKPLHWFSIMIGCNIGREINARDPLKLVSLMISLLAVIGLTTQCNFIWANRHEPMLIYTDAICTAVQCLIGLTQLLHLFVLHSQIFIVLQKAQNAEVLQDLEIFQLDIFNKNKIITDIQHILNDSWKDIKRQLHFFITAVCGVVGWYFMSCLAVNVYKTYINPQEFEINLPLPARFPMWRDKGMQFPYYFITYIIVGTELYLNGIAGIVFVGIFAVVSVHGIALLRILCKLLSYVTKEEYVPLKERLKYLKACIRLQQKVYEYCNDLKSLYKIASIPFFLLTMFVQCLVIFQASLAMDASVDLIFRVTLYYLATSGSTVIVCFNGQRLTTESEQLAFALYDYHWYNENSEFKFLTLMMIMRSNRAVEMTIGGFTSFSLMTLLAISRSSGSFFLLLREVNDSSRIEH